MSSSGPPEPWPSNSMKALGTSSVLVEVLKLLLFFKILHHSMAAHFFSLPRISSRLLKLLRKMRMRIICFRKSSRYSLEHVKALFATRKMAWSTSLLIALWGIICLASTLYNSFLPYLLWYLAMAHITLPFGIKWLLGFPEL